MLEYIFLFKTESSKLIYYSADMCQSSLLGLWVCNPSLTLSIDIYSALSTKSDAFYFPSNRKSANKRIEFTNQQKSTDGILFLPVCPLPHFFHLGISSLHPCNMSFEHVRVVMGVCNMLQDQTCQLACEVPFGMCNMLCKE